MPKPVCLRSARREVAALLKDIATLESDPALLQAVTRRAFVERGLSLVEGPLCPLCDTEWDDIAASEEASSGEAGKIEAKPKRCSSVS